MTPETAWAEAMKFENRANPYRFFDELRKTPVAHIGEGSYAITGFRELTSLLHDPRMSADLSKTRAPDPGSKIEGGTTDLYSKSSFIAMDPPEHDKARRQCMRHFGPPHTPGLVPSMEAGIQRLCNELLDKAKGKTRIDLVDEYAYPVPVWAICHILGVPLKDEPKFHAWIFDFMAGLTDPTADMVSEQGKLRAKKGLDAKNALADYLVELIEGFRKNPTDAMFSKLINDADGPDGPMSVADAATNGTLLLVAGHDPTVNTIAHTVLSVLRNPGTFELLRRRPELIPATIEESLRLESAVFFWPTWNARADIEIGGTVIPAGSRVFFVYGAANRDPRKFSNPDKFDPERLEKEHLGWGGGIHVCFGGPLARLEVNLAVENFVRRVENPRLVEDPPEYRFSPLFRGPRHLLIEFDRIND